MKTTHIPRQLTRLRKALLGKTTAGLAAGLALLATQTVQAASGTWSGATNSSWATAGNWSSLPGSADTATFNTTPGSTVDLGGSAQSVKSILFDGSTGSFTFNTGGVGGQLNLTAAGNITLASTATGTGLVQTFNAPISLGGNYSFINSRADTTSALVFAGNITNSATSTLTLTGVGTATGNTVSGIISDGTGVQSVTVGTAATNSGLWTLSGVNTYTGVTTIAGKFSALSVGTIGNGSVAGNLGAATNAASNLVFNGGNAVNGTDAATLIYTGATAETDRNFTITTNTLAAINVSNAGTNLTLSGGSAATTGGLIKTGAGTLTLAAANNHSGSTAVKNGSMVLTVAGALGTGGGTAITVAGSAGTTQSLSQTVANAITGTSSITLGGANSGTSTITLSKANNFTGGISFGNNVLNTLTLSDFNAIASASGLSGTSGTINLLSNSAGTFNTLSTFVSTSGAGTTINVGNNGSGSGQALQFGNDNAIMSIDSNRTLNITGSNGYSLILAKVNINGAGGVLNPTTASVSVGMIGNLNTTGTAPIGLGGTAAGNTVTGTISDGSGTAVTALTKSGTSTWTLSGSNTYTGKTSVSAGTLQFAKTTSLYNGTTGSWTAANITVASGATLALNVGGSGEFAVSDVNTLLANLSVASSGAGLQAGAKIGFNTSNAAGGIFTQGNVIANSTGTGGPIGLTKLGSGTLVLDKVNTYTGQTTVKAGILAMGVNNAFSAGTNFNLAGGTFAVGTFSNNSVGTLALTANSTITLGAGGLFAFANSSALDWASYSLSITGSFEDGESIRFGTDASGLTGDQLAKISINGVSGATLDGSGYLVASAIPEPATCAFFGGAVVLLGAGCVRRRRSVLA